MHVVLVLNARVSDRRLWVESDPMAPRGKSVAPIHGRERYARRRVVELRA